MSRDIRAEIRALPVTAAIAALGIDPADPQCPRCRAPLLMADAPWAGVSLRCTAPRCTLTEWCWPEGVGAEIWRTRTLAEVVNRLLEGARRYQEKRVERPRHEAAIERFDAILAGGQ